MENDETIEAADQLTPDWQQIPPVLPAVGVFSVMSEGSRADIMPYGEYSNHEVGVDIIKDGDLQNRLYVLIHGKLQISAKVSGTEIVLSEVEDGECIGEVSLLEPGPASATVRVLESAQMWSLSQDELFSYLQDHTGGGSALLMGIAQCLSGRLRQINQTIAQYHSSHSSTPLKSNGVAPIRHDTSAPTGFFDKLKQKMGGAEKKAKIRTDIKL